MEIGRKIYYDKFTGNVLQDSGERSGNVIETTIEQDFQIYVSLQERVPSTVGCVQLSYGQEKEKFIAGYGYRVDVETEELMWDLTPTQEEVITEPDPVQEQLNRMESTLDILLLKQEGIL